VHEGVEQVLEREIPVSVEWTIPFGETYFHLGVHNLPHPTARDTMSALSGYTQRPNQELLLELLTSLCAEPGVLIVLNHPMWDQAVIGVARHQAALRNLLDSVGGRIHALELNGLRQWGENRMVVELSKELNRTVISGGDRHGRERPNNSDDEERCAPPDPEIEPDCAVDRDRTWSARGDEQRSRQELERELDPAVLAPEAPRQVDAQHDVDALCDDQGGCDRGEESQG